MESAITNSKVIILFSFCSALIISGCTKDGRVAPELKQSEQASTLGKPGKATYLSARSSGATQTSSIGVYAATGECASPVESADYIVSMTGDLTGCLYTYVDDYECSPSGTYREEGREHFVGTYNGETGSFWTTYKYEAKFAGCSASGAPLGGEIKGRCQHPIVEGSGEGVFKGVTGRLDMKDDIETGNFIIRGHLRY
jgi:hypothetical protein